MAQNRTHPSDGETYEAHAKGRNVPKVAQKRESFLDYWPAAVIVLGLIVSALWCAGLMYAAHLIALWLLD